LEDSKLKPCKFHFATGKNAKPSQARFRDRQTAVKNGSNKTIFHLGSRKTPHAGFVLNFRVNKSNI